MSNDLTRPLIVVKRIKKVAGGHHGGAWKIAYADFVTAMMAFFLIMWLLGSVDGGTLNGISEYFKTPMKIALQGGSHTGDSSVIFQGGGLDLSSKAGQTARSDTPPGQDSKSDKDEEYKNLSENAKKAVLESAKKEEEKKMYELKERLQTQLQNSPRLNRYRNQFKINVSDEGLRVILTDDESRGMFKVASAEMEPYALEIIKAIAPSFNEMPNTISISGHTDATPFPGGNKNYSNWELSSERANAARRGLIAGGLDENHMLRVTGLGSAVPLDGENPTNAVNRRISIILLTKDAEKRIRDEANLKTTKVAAPTPTSSEDPLLEKVTETPVVAEPQKETIVPAKPELKAEPKTELKLEPPPVSSPSNPAPISKPISNNQEKSKPIAPAGNNAPSGKIQLPPIINLQPVIKQPDKP